MATITRSAELNVTLAHLRGGRAAAWDAWQRQQPLSPEGPSVAYWGDKCGRPTNVTAYPDYKTMQKLTTHGNDQYKRLLDRTQSCGTVGVAPVGDAFAATTHSDLVLRAKGLGCKVKHIYNASIMNAVAGCGLQLYRFGQAVSICFFTRTWRPDSFYDRIKENADLGLHTLLLLDIRVKEPSVEALCRGKKEYEPPRFMSCATCARQMLEVEEARGEKVYGPDSMCVAVARMGQDDELIKTCTLKEMCNIDMGGPLHSMVLVGETHPLENDMLAMHRATENDFLPEDQVPSQYLDDV